MKLRTDLIANVMLGNIVSPVGTNDDVEHDALAAHALLQAMEDVRVGLGAYENPSVEEIKQRADELMREWMGQ